MGGHWFHGDGPTERWAAWRENTHKQFQITRRNMFPLFLATVVVPYAIYHMGRQDLIKNDLPRKEGKAEFV